MYISTLPGSIPMRVPHGPKPRQILSLGSIQPPGPIWASPEWATHGAQLGPFMVQNGLCLH